MPTSIEFNNISKQYRLGLVSTKTLSHELNRWWQTSILKKEDPYLKIGSRNDRTRAADSEYVWALKDINLDIKQGDIVGIIGRNGSGKSTLLKILSRVTGPTTGTIHAKGRIGSLLEVGTGFHPEMTVRENIYMNGTILGMTKNDITRKLDEIVDFSGCERYLDTPVKRYSSGMIVRLGFAVAAHLEPEIMVVDEVLAVGDAEFQKKAISKMQEVGKGEGRTVLFVSHNMASVKHLCTRAVLLNEGTIAYMGGVDDTIQQYASLDVVNGTDLLSTMTRHHSNLEISSITINGKTDNHIFINENNSKLNLVIKGRLKSKQKMSVEIRITDSNEIPVLFYSPHQAASPLFPEGDFIIDETISIPEGLTNGDYYGTLMLANSCVEGLAGAPRAFTLTKEGCAAPSGRSITYRSGIGYIYIK